ncbi:hypothetical protein NE237_007874 [Protea cynaroides]|uniref:Uncharacterized protein n=1 Tax=Protea cynaroides TaxID=273540 RepID=A0A9Q0QWW0_9MAGN|nr:hypothetical protein NE237_007874 [Protea cynaroides]
MEADWLNLCCSCNPTIGGARFLDDADVTSDENEISVLEELKESIGVNCAGIASDFLDWNAGVGDCSGERRAEIYSFSSSRNPTPRGSNFNNADFYSMMGCQGFPARHSNFRLADPRPSNLEENLAPESQALSSPRFGFYPAIPAAATSYPAPNPDISAPANSNKNQQQNKAIHDAKELHKFA